MYRIYPGKVFANKIIKKDERCMRRARRLVKGLGMAESDFVWFDDGDLVRIIRERGLTEARVPQGIRRTDNPDFIFNAIDFSRSPGERADEILAGNRECQTGKKDIVGRFAGKRSYPHTAGGDVASLCGGGCRYLFEFHMVNGCLHQCNYCPAGGLVTLLLNIEEWIEKVVAPFYKAHPWQRLSRFDVDSTDIPTLEPEYDALRPLAEFHAKEGRYLVVFTKSGSVDHLLDLGLQNNLIFLWSLTAETQARVLERRSGSTRERIEAARRAQQAGYAVRFKFKPIVPLKNWRREATEMIDLLLKRVRPDNITMGSIAYMPIHDYLACIDPELLDPEILRATRNGRDETAEQEREMLPREARREMYEHYIREIRKRDADVPVALCNESEELWDDLGALMGADKREFTCNCGPMALPGLKKLSREDMATIEKLPEVEKCTK